jgi:hypothetical protein
VEVKRPPFEPQLAVQVLTKLMNQMVVNFASNQMYASAKALEGYCHFHRSFIIIDNHILNKYPKTFDSFHGRIPRIIENGRRKVEELCRNAPE